MKTKLILIAVITIIGISLFSAFKQSEGSKKYLTMTILRADLIIVDENGVITEKKISNYGNLNGRAIVLTKEINSISLKGYKLISASDESNLSSNYIFEKE
jgi:hypothetical protein